MRVKGVKGGDSTVAVYILAMRNELNGNYVMRSTADSTTSLG